jgi:hypothetical protein
MASAVVAASTQRIRPPKRVQLLDVGEEHMADEPAPAGTTRVRGRGVGQVAEGISWSRAVRAVASPLRSASGGACARRRAQLAESHGLRT